MADTITWQIAAISDKGSTPPSPPPHPPGCDSFISYPMLFRCMAMALDAQSANYSDNFKTSGYKNKKFGIKCQRSEIEGVFNLSLKHGHAPEQRTMWRETITTEHGTQLSAYLC